MCPQRPWPAAANHTRAFVAVQNGATMPAPSASSPGARPQPLAPVGDVVAEVAALVAAGVREVC
jgi:tRNA A37 methylthiotransferase MiaB